MARPRAVTQASQAYVQRGVPAAASSSLHRRDATPSACAPQPPAICSTHLAPVHSPLPPLLARSLHASLGEGAGLHRRLRFGVSTLFLSPAECCYNRQRRHHSTIQDSMSSEDILEVQAPAKPSVVCRDRYSVTLSWSPPAGLQAGAGDHAIVYTLQMHDRVRGWVTVYWGHRTREQVQNLPPGGCAHFRLRASLGDRHSPWGATFAASTTEDKMAVVHLERAVAAGKTAVVKKVLASRPSAADLLSRGGVSPLAQASLRGDALTVSLLLAAGADADRAGGGAGRTPLMLAAAQGHMDVCTLLLERGATWRTSDWSGCTPLHYAVDASQLEVVRLALDSGADIDARDNQGWTPLMRGVSMESSEEVLRELVRRGASLDAEDRRGQTALMQAVLAARADAVSLLLEAGASRQRRNLYGNTAIDMARARNLKEIVRLLMNTDDGTKNDKRKTEQEEDDLQQQDTQPSSQSAMVLAAAKAKEVAL